MTIAFAILAACLIGVLCYARYVDGQVDSILTILAETSLKEKDFRSGLKKEMTKLHAYCEENEKKLAELEKKQEEFSQLADESVRAQIDAEKAWAEGVRAIAGFGASIPTLNTKGIENE